MSATAESNRAVIVASLVVFSTAVSLRIPSCYESFWVDELHSAWCVWGSLADVVPRATLGNQTPYYFVGLWFWKQLVGDSEVMLRLSSVLAVSLACVVLTVGVARHSGLVPGIAAGLVLAVESNSLFFGTELRPYAMVIFFGCVAIVSFLNLLQTEHRQEDRRSWLCLVTAIFLAAALQPTSLGVLLLLPAFLLLRWLVRSPKSTLRFSISDGLVLSAAVAIGIMIWIQTLQHSWVQRSSWHTFAAADNLLQVWQAWDWTSLAIVPLAIGFIAAWRFREHPEIHQKQKLTILLAIIALGGTTLYWSVSKLEWVPIWHRRYFIAALPVLACVVGSAVGSVQSAALRRHSPRWRIGLTIATAVGLILLLAYRQDTLARLTRYPVALVSRGEDWKSAVEYIARTAAPNDRVFLDSGLIESSVLNPRCGLDPGPSAEMLDYLLYPVAGPYHVGQDVEHLAPNLVLEGYLGTSTKSEKKVFIITRRPLAQVDISVNSPTVMPKNHSERLSFGNVSLVVYPTLFDREALLELENGTSP